MREDLLFTYDFPPMGGGISRWMEAMSRTYPPGTLRISTGEMPEALASDAALPNPVDRVRVSSERLRTIPGLLSWSRRAIDLARPSQVRFAWCSSLRPAATPAWWAHRKTALPYGIILYGGDLLILREKVSNAIIKRAQVRRLIADASVVVAISNWTAEQYALLAEDLGLTGAMARARVIPLGTDIERFRDEQIDCARFQESRGLPDDAEWMLTVARLVPHKGIDTAIRAFARLAHAHPKLRYLVIGRGPYEAELRLLAGDLGVADRVEFLTDVRDDELPAAYLLADFYIGLSRQSERDVEGFGISFLEAASSGLPVVAGRSGGVPDAVADGETGFLVDPLDLDQICATLTRLIDNPEASVVMGERGAQRAMRAFSWQHSVDQFRAVAEEFGRAE